MEAGYFQYVDVINDLIQVIQSKEGDHMVQAGQMMADAISQGGIIQAFGSGHSYAAVMEVVTRAGGFIPTKAMIDPAGGIYEMVEGVGTQLVKQIEVLPQDLVFIISNSGRNPLAIEVANFIKQQGAKLIVITSLASSKAMTSRHSSGKRLYELADLVLDNHVAFGDASISIDGLATKICGTSSIAASFLIQGSVVEAVSRLLKKGYEPPIYKSANIDGGREYNEKIAAQYAERIYHK